MFSRLSKKHSRQLSELRKALGLRSTQAALEFAIEQTADSLWSSDGARGAGEDDADAASSAKASQSATWKVTGGPVVDDENEDDDEESERET